MFNVANDCILNARPVRCMLVLDDEYSVSMLLTTW